MTRPRLVESKGRLIPGLLAVALFGVMAAVFITAEFGSPTGFPGEGSITAAIGYHMFNIGGQAAYGGERFLITFETIDAVLVAALVAAVMLARREEDEGMMTALTDGGRELGKTIRGTEDEQPETETQTETEDGGAD